MNTDERRDLIETLVHHYEHELKDKVESKVNLDASIKSYRNELYSLGAADLLEEYKDFLYINDDD